MTHEELITKTQEELIDMVVGLNTSVKELTDELSDQDKTINGLREELESAKSEAKASIEDEKREAKRYYDYWLESAKDARLFKAVIEKLVKQ